MQITPISPQNTIRNRWILVAVESVSKWVIAKPHREALTNNVIQFFRDEIIAFSGIPADIVIDRGQNFLSNAMERFLQEGGIVHRKTSPYHPQSNGQVERVNKNIGSLIRKAMITFGGHWDDYLQHAVFVCRATKHSTTGFSPFFLLFGVEARISGS